MDYKETKAKYFNYIIIALIVIILGGIVGNIIIKSTHKVEEIKIRVNTSIPINTTRKAYIDFIPNDVEEQIFWTSSDESIASVTNGVIKGNKVGKATITATTSNGISNSVIVTIYEEVDIKLDKTSVVLYEGESIQLNASVTPENTKLKWSSLTPWSISVDDNGLVKAIEEETDGKVYVSNEDGTIYQTCYITVKKAALKTNYGFNETFIFDDLEITIGSNYTFTKVDNRYSDYHNKTVIKLPITVKNLSSETHGLNMFYYDIYGSYGTEVKKLSTYFDDTVDFAGDLRSGASYTKYLYFLYDGNGEYAIEFDNHSKKITVEFEINR